MAWTLEDSGTKTTAATEDTLSTKTTNKTFVFEIDTNAMALGDIIRIKIYTTVLTAGTSRVFQDIILGHPQAEPIKQSQACASDIEYHVTIQRLAGSDRSYAWKLLSV